MMGFVAEERARRCQEYVEALEEEKRKIQVFPRELPLCLELVTQTIESYRQQMGGEVFPGRSECDEETTSDGPVLEEFIPIKRSSSTEEEEDSHDSRRRRVDGDRKDGEEEEHKEERSDQKPDWLRSVQLWNAPKEDRKPSKPIAVEAKKATGAFHPFHREKCPPPAVAVPSPPSPAAAASSTADTGGGSGGGGSGSRASGGGEEKEGQSHRKARRCWSPELHRRFLHALQQLGGSHAATPKQIRELMKVDGLTNDEVKSHLQKYRLHTRRPSPVVQPNNNPLTPQFVLVGGIWVPPPPPEYAAAAAAAAVAAQPATEVPGTPATGIYTPVASHPLDQQCNQKKQEQRVNGGLDQRTVSGDEHSLGGGDGDEDATNSISPATSSSSLTITISPTHKKKQQS